MADHDQRFKVLLHEFLEEFVRLFFPDAARQLDLTRVEWLEQEVIPDGRGGRTRRLDLVARVQRRTRHSGRRGAAWIVHVEVESGDRAARLRPRMFEYFTHLRRRYRFPILPIGLYLRAGLGGVGRDVYEDRLGDWAVIRFEYAAVGLPAVDAAPILRGTNPLGIALASLMRLPPDGRPQLMIHLLRRVGELEPAGRRRDLLVDCIEAYFPLTAAERAEYHRLTLDPTNREIWQMLTISEIRGQRKLVELQLEKKFGPLPQAAREKLADWPGEGLEQLAEALLDAGSLHELGLVNGPFRKTKK